MDLPHATEEEATSDYEESFSVSDFTSIQTARLLHIHENGRRYQGFLQNRYGMPNDEAEQLREGIKHKLYCDYVLEGKPFFAPVGSHPQKIVDLGTGVGYWVLDIAERFPSARVIGTDLSPIQPQWAPPNAEFRVEDLDHVDRPWSGIYADADLIHHRFVLQCIRNPRLFLKRALHNLKPGGWMECHDLIPRLFSEDDTLCHSHPMHKLYNLIDASFSAVYGWNISITDQMPGLLQEVGFINISERRTKIPVGRWHQVPKMREMGMFNHTILADFLPTVFAKHKIMGISADEAHSIGQEILDTFNDPNVHAHNIWVSYWAQKPMDD